MEDNTVGILCILGAIAFVVLIVVLVNANDKHKEERKDALNKEINKLPNNGKLQTIIGTASQYAFILDNVSKMIYYIDTQRTYKVSFDKIISVEILEDNILLSSKSTTRTIGGALLGGAIAGGAGMIVGGLSGNTKQKKEVSKMTVKIKIRDFSTSSLSIVCYDASKANGQIYNTELQNAQKIADYVSVIIDEVDSQDKQAQNAKQDIPKISSVADELTKLAALKDQGILTDEEFQFQKKKLLNK